MRTFWGFALLLAWSGFCLASTVWPLVRTAFHFIASLVAAGAILRAFFLLITPAPVVIPHKPPVAKAPVDAEERETVPV